MNVLPLSY